MSFIRISFREGWLWTVERYAGGRQWAEGGADSLTPGRSRFHDASIDLAGRLGVEVFARARQAGKQDGNHD
ncbi:hypothetical protein [Candidatus Palauibacter sp.]|uniref:hypothetical protein n=1 Tax=Candidatus Palauibacter sp. TaxID=3101350 RepID=UPI003B02275B